MNKSDMDKKQKQTIETMSQTNKIALFSIPIAILVFLLKYISYALTDSVALYSDALESIVNIVAACTAWWTIRISMKPADDNHPFGHHKAEYFSAGFEGALITLSACLIFYQSWDALHSGHSPNHSEVGLIVNFCAGILNGLWAFFLIRQGKKYRSPALIADGNHLAADVITSVGILLGILIVFWSGWFFLDPVLAIFVALYILWQGWKLMKSSIQGLMDISPPLKDTLHIRNIISDHAQDAIEFHDLRTRIAGSVIFIEFHLVVAANMTVKNAHMICDTIEDALNKQMGNIRTIIHVEPEDEAKSPLD